MKKFHRHRCNSSQAVLLLRFDQSTMRLTEIASNRYTTTAQSTGSLPINYSQSIKTIVHLQKFNQRRLEYFHPLS